MRKTFCDKCGKDCTGNERDIVCVGGTHYLWLDDTGEVDVGKNLTLCLDCKGKFEKVIQEFIYPELLTTPPPTEGGKEK